MATVRWTPDHPIDFAASIRRHERWGEDPVNIVRDGALFRVARGAPYRAEQDVDGTFEIVGENPTHALCDLQAKLAESLPHRPLEMLAARNERVARLVQQHGGLRPPIISDPFQSLITSITAQQVNLTWATTTRRRLVHQTGRRHSLDGVELWEFPSPERLAKVTVSQLRDLQFTTRKAEYIIGVAEAACEGTLDGLEALSNDEVIARLVAMRGIGRWSADWLLARCLGRPDVVAAGDLGVRKAVSFSYHSSDTILSEEVVRSTADTWDDAANWTAHLLLDTL